MQNRRVLALKTQNSIKLELVALEYTQTAPRSSTTRGQRYNGELFAYLTAKKSSVSTAYRCCIAKSDPQLDFSCQDSHVSDVSGAWAVLQNSSDE